MLKGLLCLLIFFCVIVPAPVFAQWNENYYDLKQYIQSQSDLNIDSSNYLSIYRNKELHYLYPLYKAFKQEAMLIQAQGRTDYYTDLKQSLAFLGDYAGILEIEKMERVNATTDSIKKDIAKQGNPFLGGEFKDARKYVIDQCKNKQVVMIDEAHEKPQHRVFTHSLLVELYQNGFRYLALETLNPYPNASLKHVNMLTGHFTCEPLAGELVRWALTIGYTLVAYEDTSSNHTVNQREYAQAENLNKILLKDKAAKILVHAGAAHLEEGANADGRIPMAAYFKIISGIDPLTIDQTTMTEGSNGNYGALWYNKYSPTLNFTIPMVPLKDGKAKDLFDYHLYDIYIYHPPTKFKNGRPLFNTLNDLKKETAVQPIYKTMFFVQAFYDNEYTEKRLGTAVPADQTYSTSTDGYYYLYLQKGRYELVYRDKHYKILGSKVLVVE